MPAPPKHTGPTMPMAFPYSILLLRTTLPKEYL